MDVDALNWIADAIDFNVPGDLSSNPAASSSSGNVNYQAPVTFDAGGADSDGDGDLEPADKRCASASFAHAVEKHLAFASTGFVLINFAGTASSSSAC